MDRKQIVGAKLVNRKRIVNEYLVNSRNCKPSPKPNPNSYQPLAGPVSKLLGRNSLGTFPSFSEGIAFHDKLLGRNLSNKWAYMVTNG